MSTPINQESLIGGELSPTLSARIGLERYGHSVERMENFVVSPHGGAENRAGTEFFGLAKYQVGDPFAGYQVRLIPFSPSSSENYILEFGHLYVRVWNKDGLEQAPAYNTFVQNPDPDTDPTAATILLSLGANGAINGDGVSTRWAQKFISPAFDITVSSVSVRLSRTTFIPSVNVTCTINVDNGGDPGAVFTGLGAFTGPEPFQLPSSDFSAAPVVSRPMVTFQADTPTLVPASTVLHLVFRHDMEADYDTNLSAGYMLGASNGNNFTYSIPQVYNGIWLTPGPATQDVCFSIQGYTGFSDVELETPYTSILMNDIGTDSMVSTLTFTQSVDVMTICDATGVNPVAELSHLGDGVWSLANLPGFVSIGAPLDVTVDVAVPKPVIAPTRTWQYAVSGISIEGQESLPTLSAEIAVGADISLSLPLQLKIKVGDTPVDHYAVYKGLDGTYGFVGYARSKRAATEAFDDVYNRVYAERFRYWIRYYSSRTLPTGPTGPGRPRDFAEPKARQDALAAAALASGENGVDVGVTFFIFRDDNLAPSYTDQPRNGTNQFTVDGGLVPRAVAYFQQRLVFANVQDRPDTLFFSEVGDFRSFQRSTPTVDDDAIEATLAAGELNEIRHLVPLRSLLVMTTGAEHVLSAEKGPVTPSNLDAAPLSHRGISRLFPLVIGNVVLFKDIGGQIREWIYSQETNDYPAADLGFLASHLFKDYKIMDWTYISAPRSVVWCVRSDGTLLSFTYVREQSVAGWARHSTALTGGTGRSIGKFRAITSLRNPDTGQQDLYLVVTRDIDGDEVTFIERQKPRDILTSPFCDCSEAQQLRNQESEGKESQPGGKDWEFKDLFRPALYGGTANDVDSFHLTITATSLKDDRLKMAPHSQMGLVIHAGHPGTGSTMTVLDNTEDTFTGSGWTAGTPALTYPWYQGTDFPGGWDHGVELYRPSTHQLDPLVPEYQNVKGSKMLLHVPRLPLASVDNGVKWVNLFMGDGERFPCKVVTVVANATRDGNGNYTPVAGLNTSTFYIVEIERTISAYGTGGEVDLLEGPPNGPLWDGTRWEEAKRDWTIGNHLGIAQSLAVQADLGANEEVLPFPAGTLSISQPANRLVVGLPYVCTIKSLRVSSSKMDVRTNQKVITRVHVDVTDTLGIEAGVDENDLQEFEINSLANPISKTDGRIAVRTSNRPERNGQIFVRQSKPLPATILSLTPEVELGG